MKPYLLLIRFTKKTVLTELQSRVDGIKKTIESLTTEKIETPFVIGANQEFGPTMGILVKTDKTAKEIYQALNSGKHKTSLMLNDDHLLILELGSDFHGVGFSSTWTWLQHH